MGDNQAYLRLVAKLWFELLDNVIDEPGSSAEPLSEAEEAEHERRLAWAAKGVYRGPQSDRMPVLPDLAPAVKKMRALTLWKNTQTVFHTHLGFATVLLLIAVVSFWLL